MKNIDSISHVKGRSVYVDDIPERAGTLHAVVFHSPCAHGIIKGLDVSEALNNNGVHAILTASDIPGENQIGGVIPDEPLFADGKVEFAGQPVALVVASDEATARKARRLIKIEVEELEAVTGAREAYKKSMFLSPPGIFISGDIEKAWRECEYIFEGQCESGGQEHLYIEGQASYAYLNEDGAIRIISSTQGPTHVQKTAAAVLGLPMHRIEVDVTRLGGGFGGKEDQATPYACMAALAAMRLKKAVKIVLHRLDDMIMTGKRHPYSADYKIGLSAGLKIIAYQARLYQNGGAAADLSPAILDRSLFHSTNAYYIPNTEVTAYSCKTNLPPNTAFRGFGGPQGMFVIESAIARAAHELKTEARTIQERNFLSSKDHFQYGQKAAGASIRKCYKLAAKEFQIERLSKEVREFNSKNGLRKKGIAMMPVCFGISFTSKHMNQARALVHIYQDGSVGVSTGAVEMGQGVNTKIVQVVAKTLAVDPGLVRIETTNTTRVSNTSPTAASSGADLNGKAAQIACSRLASRLKRAAANKLGKEIRDIELSGKGIRINGKSAGISWKEAVKYAYMQRICLSEQGHYSTPGIDFNRSISKGQPFAYHVYGAAIVTVNVDCIRGTYEVERVNIVHDFGNCMNTLIDMGQVEGALMQGIGWMTMEEFSWDKNGHILSKSLSTYKVPDIYSAPGEVNCIPLPSKGPAKAILKSKAVGEPPLMYGIGVYFALQNAIISFNPSYRPDFNAPLTPEKVLMRLYSSRPGKKRS